MSTFTMILGKKDLVKHDGRPLWNYNLSDIEFRQLQEELSKGTLCNLDARDAALYFAEWWKRNYNGGPPSIQGVFDSLGKKDVMVFTAHVFYENARNGARMLGIKWIQKQNTLFFRTLLLQGGIPIKHISANKTYYQNFLLRLLELQPSTVEEIVMRPDLTSLLPVSSRNETIYENCLSIVISILKEENTYSALLGANSALKEIQEALQVRKHQLSKATRSIRPKIFWVMNLEESVAKVYLRIGFSSKYSAVALAEILNLSEPTNERTYTLYLDEKLVCSFRKTLGGEYKTEWENQKFYQWNTKQLSPQFYCVCNNEQWEVNDLITISPTIYEPTLWVALGDSEWRLVKGNATNNTQSLLLLPTDWKQLSHEDSIINIDEHLLNTIQFEGQISVTKADLFYTYFSNIESFEWNIKTNKPNWMRKAGVSVVTRQLSINVYNSEGKFVLPRDYKVYLKKSGSDNSWQLLDVCNPLPIGLIDVKIEYLGVIAYDKAYNIGDLKLEIINQNLSEAKLKWSNFQMFSITMAESSKFSVTTNNETFCLKLNTEQPSIPDSIPIKLKLGSQKSLYFDISTPFSGIGLIDKDGRFLKEGSELILNDLHGIRILTTNAGGTIIKIWNKLRGQVKIFKTIHFAYQPLISFREELQRLFYLADAMRHDNLVMIEISNGILKKNYCVKGFSHAINDVSTQFERKVKMATKDMQLELFVVPLNCSLQEIQLLSLQMDEENCNLLPQDIANGQFIVISEFSNGKQLQPRFINTDPDYKGKSPAERMNHYHSVLLESDYSLSAWKELQAYYDICLRQQIPFSTFDQIRAISRSSKLAAKAFFALGINQLDKDDFIQLQVPAMEQNLGFSFHWIRKEDWEESFAAAEKWVGAKYTKDLYELISKYFKEINLDVLCRYINGGKITEAVRINNQIINEARAQLGERVLSELPEHTPHTTSEYNIQVANNHMVKLLLRAPIAVSESIKGIAEKSIWEDNEFVADLRRNIQYAHFVAPELYTKTLYHCLS